jgi:hypothetical protein
MAKTKIISQIAKKPQQKTNSKTILLFGFPFWVQSVVFWVGFISIIVMGFMHEARQYVAIGVALCIVSLILRRKWFNAIFSGITFSILWWTFLTWGVKGSMIASLIYLPVVLGIVVYQIMKIKKEKPEEFEKLIDLFKGVKRKI